MAHKLLPFFRMASAYLAIRKGMVDRQPPKGYRALHFCPMLSTIGEMDQIQEMRLILKELERDYVLRSSRKSTRS